MERGHQEDLDVDGNIKINLKKYSGVCELIDLRTGTSGGLLEQEN